MKKIIYIITVFILSALIFSSCDKVLDVSPTTELADQVALNSTVGLQSALMGAYDKLQNGDLYGGRYWVSADMIAGTVKISGLQNTVFEELQMLNKTMSAQSNRIVQATWQVSYEAIGIINRLLSFLPNVNDADMTVAVRERIEGEAKFIRAIVFFQLTRLYSHDVPGWGPLAVPIFTEPLSPFDKPARATLADAYDQIIQDLQDATTLLKGKNTQGRASDVAAQAMLSRVNLYKGDYTAVETAANYVINKFTGQPNGGLADDVLDCFTAGSPDPEVLFRSTWHPRQMMPQGLSGGTTGLHPMQNFLLMEVILEKSDIMSLPEKMTQEPESGMLLLTLKGKFIRQNSMWSIIMHL